MIYQIGKHRVRHGDVADESGISELVSGATADIFYSDPPWGSGNLKYWETMNKKMNGVSSEFMTKDVGEFLDIVLGHSIRYTDGWVVIEYGKRWTDLLIQKALDHGLSFCGKVEALYGSSNHPLDIVFFRTDGPRQIDLSPIYHLKGYKCVKEIFKLLKPSSGGVGMDLCCGMGYTAQACIDNGLSFIGNEVNKARLNKTIARLEKDKSK